MNPINLQKVGINYEEGLRRFMNKPELYHKYLIRFCENPAIEKLQEAIHDQDYEQAFAFIHDLKGISGNLSMKHFYMMVSRLTEALRLEKDVDYIKMLTKQVEEEYQTMVAVIKQELEL